MGECPAQPGGAAAAGPGSDLERGDRGDRLVLLGGDELAACAGPGRLSRLAARFAAKEAAIKAFSRPDTPFVPREIEVVTAKPLVTLRLSGSAAELAAAQHWRQLSLSLTHAECHAAAVVVAVCGTS